MVTVVLFRSALGRRPAVHRFAARLRAAGHEVHAPDLYNGAVFDALAAGEAYRDRIGISRLLERAIAAVDRLPADLVYGGLSMGTAPAQVLAATRPGARGAVLMHGALPLELLEIERWPAQVPVQLHVTEHDVAASELLLTRVTAFLTRRGAPAAAVSPSTATVRGVSRDDACSRTTCASSGARTARPSPR